MAERKHPLTEEEQEKLVKEGRMIRRRDYPDYEDWVRVSNEFLERYFPEKKERN